MIERITNMDTVAGQQLLDDLAPRFVQEAELPTGFQRGHMSAMLQCGLDSNMMCVYLWRADGVALGVIGAAAFPDFFSGVTIAQELFWYVVPESRGGMNAIRLLEHARRWAKSEAGADYFLMAARASHPKVGDIYERLGFKALEQLYGMKL